jgi:uncharacterized membrane protein
MTEGQTGFAASTTRILPVVHRISSSDLIDSLHFGFGDFEAMPSHAIFLCVIYPLVGIFLVSIVSGNSMLQLAFPIAAGFALVGPFAAVGLYELSRRREAGLDTSPSHAFGVLRSPSLGAIAALGLLLMAIFILWLAVAQAVYVANFGYAAPKSIPQFISNVFSTSEGWRMIIAGTLIGFLFAVAVLTISVVSFPLLLDRVVGVPVALLTSIHVVALNPWTMALWGLIVATLLIIGSMPFFLGLPVVMPVLGHATWHLYRKAVDASVQPRAEPRPIEKPYRSAADFPAALFPAIHRKSR